ncbi:unnamed protein product [Heterotrigona itama]|uniref:Ribonuclease n=1 Tax=Heterotrigona itama TaxID=395501 RepID=A0A6V7H499_9HYME|nr:unnamed protein product [Heterotrigona itama]
MDEIKETRPEENYVKIHETDINITSKEDLASFFKNWDHDVNKVYTSDIPQICKDEPCQLGIDEAGRGPILGPMIYGIAYVPLSEKQLPVDLGCVDSKTLTEEHRDKVFNKICEHRKKIGWAVEVISPNTIANSMYRRVKFSLNDVSMKSAIELTQLVIERGANIAELYVDTVGTISSVYGCGYPNDPDTKKWLFDNVDDVFGFPRVVRFSWSPAERILQSHALSVEWEEVEEEENRGEQKISKFFAGSSAKKRHKFFIDRCLSNNPNL